MVVNHDIELSETTDVDQWAWAAQYRNRTVAPAFDDESHVMEGWVIPDMTLEQIKRLRVKMRHMHRSQEFNLLYEIPTVTEAFFPPFDLQHSVNQCPCTRE